MEEVVVGVLAVLVGAAFCFRGYLAMRVIIPMWGGLVGFLVGAALADTFTGDGLLTTTTSWLVAIVVGLVFAILAYLSYLVSVLLGMAAIGWVLGTTLLVALGVTWSWVIVLGGLAVGVLLALLALAVDLPMTLLTLLTALGGAAVVVTGLMLLVGTIDVAQLGDGNTTRAIDDSWPVYLAYLGLVIAGIVVQLRDRQRRLGGLRSAWRGRTGHRGVPSRL